MSRSYVKPGSTWAIIYTRVSTKGQETCALQEAECRYYAEAHGLEVVEVFTDDGLSGTSLDRPGLNAARRFIARCEVGGTLLVYHIDRSTRADSREWGTVSLEIERASWEIVTLNGSEGDAAGAHQESVKRSKRVTDRMMDLARKGELRPMRTPYGFAKEVQFHSSAPVTVIPRTTPTGRLPKGIPSKFVPGDPIEVEAVKLIFDLYGSDTMGTARLAEKLNERGIPSPSGGRWYSASVNVLLQNHAYIGTLRWNQRSAGKLHEVSGGKVLRRHINLQDRKARNPREDWILADDSHEALVDRALFERCQAVAERRGRAKGGARYGTRYGLQRILHCETCGYAYTGKPGGVGRQARYSHRSEYHPCRDVSVTTPKIDGTAIAVLQDLFEHLNQNRLREHVDAALERKQGRCSSQEDHARTVTRLRREIAQGLDSLFRVSGAAADALATKIETRQAELERLLAAPPVATDRLTTDDVLAFARNLGSLGLDLPAADLNRLFSLFIEALYLDLERAPTPAGKKAKPALLRGGRLVLTAAADRIYQVTSTETPASHRRHHLGGLLLRPADFLRIPAPRLYEPGVAQ